MNISFSLGCRISDIAYPESFHRIIKRCHAPQSSHYRHLGLLPDTKNCQLRMRREWWERFPHHRLQRKPLISDPGMHHDTCVTHVPWCMPGSLIHGGGENVPGIPGACTTHNFTYLARGPYKMTHVLHSIHLRYGYHPAAVGISLNCKKLRH